VLDESGFEPGRCNRFIHSPNHPDRHRYIPSKLFNWYQGVKWSGREADLLPTSRTEVKNEWAYISTPSMYLDGADKYNFTLTVTHIGCTSTLESWVRIPLWSWMHVLSCCCVRAVLYRLGALRAGVSRLQRSWVETSETERRV